MSLIVGTWAIAVGTRSLTVSHKLMDASGVVCAVMKMTLQRTTLSDHGADHLLLAHGLADEIARVVLQRREASS